MTRGQHRRPQPLIFLGPSLPRAEAELVCPGEYVGPVARGDLPALAGATARAIVIIDGRFREHRAVSPKEIMATLDRGHEVYGAASMGALRAVEMERFGMRGVGRIFHAFKSGELVADDEVAVCFDPDTLQPLSEALATIRVGLLEAVTAGLLSDGQRRRLLAIGQRLHYTQRSYRRLLAEGDLPAEQSTRLIDFLGQKATDVKAEDAREVLRAVARAKVRSQYFALDLPLRTAPPGPGPTLSELPPSPKLGAWDTVRTVLVEETEQRLNRVRSVVGITRVADVEGLDVLGVPNYVAVRPSRDGHCNSTYSGKAMRPAEARVGAQMEALEMACALDDRVARERTTYEDLARASRPAVHPDALIPFCDAPDDLKRLELDWVTGWDIVTGEAVFVPADAVYFRRDMEPTYWKISSNGLASGNTWAEAIAHSLAELIERDAETMFRLSTEYGRYPGMLRLVAGPRRLPAPDWMLPAPRDFPLVRLSTLPDPLRELVVRFRERDVRVSVRCITSDVRVPTIICALWELTGDCFRHLVQYGCGTHPDALIATRRAITEATQSRVTAIQGSREDLEAAALARSTPPEDWFDGGDDGIGFDQLPRVTHDDVRDDVGFMVERLADAGLNQIVAVDLSNPMLDFPVVKLLVPGLELAFHDVKANRIPFGWRARRYFDPEPPAARTHTTTPISQGSNAWHENKHKTSSSSPTTRATTT